VPVLTTQAERRVGIDEVLAAIARHRAARVADPAAGERAAARRAGDLVDVLEEELRRRLEAGLGAASNGLGPLVSAVRDGSLDPYSAALRILGDADARGRRGGAGGRTR
jgi:LAO/AO transport system kinase